MNGITKMVLRVPPKDVNKYLAAPDMYEALKDYAPLYAEIMMQVDVNVRIMAVDFFTKIYHALTKAEGK